MKEALSVNILSNEKPPFSGTFIFRLDANRNPPAYRKIGSHFAPARAKDFYQIIQDHVCHVLMEGSFVTERLQIKFERFGFD